MKTTEEKEKLNELTLMVRPANIDLIKEIFEKEYLLGEKEYIKVTGDAVYENVIIDDDCCYGFLEKRWHKGKVEIVFDVFISIVKTRKAEDGEMHETQNRFRYGIGESEFDTLLLPPVSLKEFMGRRYDYNPRIKRNMREFLEDANNN